MYKNDTIIHFSARIKPGARVWEEHWWKVWPIKQPDENIEFAVEYNGRHFDCKAFGYGQRGSGESYGNGSLFVTDMSDFVDSPDLAHVAIIVFEHQKNKILEKIVAAAKELDDLRQSYETLLTKAPKPVR